MTTPFQPTPGFWANTPPPYDTGLATSYPFNVDQANTRHQLEAAQTEKLRVETAHLKEAYEHPRTFLFTDGVTAGTTDTCMEVLSHWAGQSKEPITIKIMSPGGSIYAGFALYDFLLELREEVDIITQSMSAASIAALIAQAGTTRTITPNGYMMVHQASTIAQGSSSTLRDQSALLDQLEDQYMRLMVQRANVDIDFVKSKTDRKDWWMNSLEALEHGFVDSIRTPAI